MALKEYIDTGKDLCRVTIKGVSGYSVILDHPNIDDVHREIKRWFTQYLEKSSPEMYKYSIVIREYFIRYPQDQQKRNGKSKTIIVYMPTATAIKSIIANNLV